MRHESQPDAENIARARMHASPEQSLHPRARREQFVAAYPREECPAPCRLEEWSVQMEVGRKQQSVSLEPANSGGPDEIELVAKLKSDPIVQAEMRDDRFLPFEFIRCRCVGEARRHRDRQRAPFLA